MTFYLLSLVLFFPVGLVTVAAVRRRGVKGLFRQSVPNPTPAMCVMWVVVQLGWIVSLVTMVGIFLTEAAIYNARLPTVPDALYTHPTQVMGHRAYLSDGLHLLFSGMWWAGGTGLCVGAVAAFIYGMLKGREEDKEHKRRMEWMKNRPE